MLKRTSAKKINASGRPAMMALAFVFLSACAANELTSTESRTIRSGESADASGEINKNRIVAKNYLDNLFSLQRPTVGIAQIKNNEVPVVVPIKISNRNIAFQIFRCEAENEIEGLLETFDNESQELAKRESAKSYFAKNKFWIDIRKKCTKTAESWSGSEFLDSSAPSGNFRWLMRACLIGSQSEDQHCSDSVFASDPLKGYQNRFSEIQQTTLERINRQMLLIGGISSSFPERASQLALALESCGEQEWNKASRQLMRSLLLNIIGMGSAIIFEIFGPTETAAKSWVEKTKAIWQPTNDMQNNGKAVTRILSWLFTNQHDFKETCAIAEEIRIAAASEVLRLQALQIQLASDLDEAVRLELPLPREVQP
ncbi:MAG: hypothetical protein ACO3A4_11360 [Silvanigrellaceae bacterium]